MVTQSGKRPRQILIEADSEARQALSRVHGSVPKRNSTDWMILAAVVPIIRMFLDTYGHFIHITVHSLIQALPEPDNEHTFQEQVSQHIALLLSTLSGLEITDKTFCGAGKRVDDVPALFASG